MFLKNANWALKLPINGLASFTMIFKINFYQVIPGLQNSDRIFILLLSIIRNENIAYLNEYLIKNVQVVPRAPAPICRFKS